MKKLKTAFAVVCILIMLFLLTGCTKESVTEEKRNNETSSTNDVTSSDNTVTSSDNEIYSEALRLKSDGKKKEAYDLISKHEDSDDMYLQFLLGDFYYYGYGVEKNYEKGYGTEKSNPQALEWYKKASEQGNVYALQRTCLVVYL